MALSLKIQEPPYTTRQRRLRSLAFATLPPVITRFVRVIQSANMKPMKGGWVYIMTNKRNGTLYMGVTSDIARRV